MKTQIFFYFQILILLSIIFFIIKKIFVLRENYKRTLSLCFLKVSLPKKDSDLDEKKETLKDFKEMVSIMEQFLSSMKSIYSHRIERKFLGQDLISLEYIVYESEIYFYVVTPKKYKDLIEKQIT
jgi:hypothetical protein